MMVCSQDEDQHELVHHPIFLPIPIDHQPSRKNTSVNQTQTMMRPIQVETMGTLLLKMDSPTLRQVILGSGPSGLANGTARGSHPTQLTPSTSRQSHTASITTNTTRQPHLQDPRAGGADERAHGHVGVGWAALVAVEASPIRGKAGHLPEHLQMRVLLFSFRTRRHDPLLLLLHCYGQLEVSRWGHLDGGMSTRETYRDGGGQTPCREV